MKLPTLYHKDKHGRIRQWRVWSDGPTIYTEYGMVGGEMQISSKEAAPTNVGRSNERNAVAQADFEAQSLWTFKKDRKYSETPEAAEAPLVLPMLAQKYKRGGLPFPVYTQPKLDGLRCLTFEEEGKIVLLSRAGKRYTVPHVAEALAKVLPQNSMFDGELYVHGTSLQSINSWVKKQQVNTLKISYCIYDMPVVNGDDLLPFSARLAALEKIALTDPATNLVPTDTADNHDEIVLAERKMVEAGYEGLIVRAASGIYRFGYRSSELLKCKTFDDAEFKVIGCGEGVGKFKGCAIFVCQNDLNDRTFSVTPKCTMEDRAAFWDNRHEYVGRSYTVRFFGRTNLDIPFLPVGIAFRDEKDLG
jgi:DNA ligase 1